jgi:hypothetical protein
LNAAGYRSTGNRGRNPFTKDSVRPLLQNRFYLGQLPDGRGSWVQGQHDAVLDEDLYDAAVQARAGNRRSFAAGSSPARTYSLSGLARCGLCGGALHFHTRPNGVIAVYCYQRRQGGARCPQREQPLEAIEAQISAYLATFRLDDETVDRIVEFHASATEQHDDSERERRELSGRLERIAEMYKWGDLTREAYRADREQIERKLAELRGTSTKADLLAKTAAFLRDLPAAWVAGRPEQRNALARLVFRSVEITDDRATAILVNADFAPFFLAATGHEETPDTEVSGVSSNGRKRRASLLHLPTPKDYLPFVGGACPAMSPTRRRRDARIARSERDARVREMALAGAPWPAIAAEVGLSPTRVRQLCADLPPRKAGRPWHR